MVGKLKIYSVPVLVVATLLLIFLLSFLLYDGTPLLSFINISFYFCSAYIFVGLFLMVVENGFFDGISYGFRKLFRKSNQGQLDDDSEIEPLSEMISLPYVPLLTSGIIIMILMLLGLFFWY